MIILHPPVIHLPDQWFPHLFRLSCLGVARPGTGWRPMRHDATDARPLSPGSHPWHLTVTTWHTERLRSNWEIVCVTFHTPESLHNMSFVWTQHSSWFVSHYETFLDASWQLHSFVITVWWPKSLLFVCIDILLRFDDQEINSLMLEKTTKCFRWRD